MKPWLWIPSSLAHQIGPLFVRLASFFFHDKEIPAWNQKTIETEKFKMDFKNPIGIAGGVDKSGSELIPWQTLGCGFLEVGTITPEPQDPNPGKTMDRDYKNLSLWNRMGFPSPGADVVLENIQSIEDEIKVPLFVNIGKNRYTPNEKAHEDYAFLVRKFKNYASAYVVNISSPNTQNLRSLSQPEFLTPFLSPILEERSQIERYIPIFVKLSPDMSNTDLENTLNTCLSLGVDGFVLTNTTLSRDFDNSYSVEGGVSGLPLKQKSIQALKIAYQICSAQKDKKILISVGGVMTAEDVFERIELGADLVQVYASLIFEGPLFFRKVAEVAEQRKNRNQFQS